MDADENNGDLTNAISVKKLATKLREKEPNGVDLYTSDAGIAVDSDYNSQEKLTLKLHFGQAVCGLLSLKIGGNIVLKHFTLFEPFNLSLIILLQSLFKNLYIIKPVTSKATNSEIYIVGLDFIGISSQMSNVLLSRLQNFNNNPLLDLTLYENDIEMLYAVQCDLFRFNQISFIEEAITIFNKFRYNISEFKYQLERPFSPIDDWIRQMSIQRLQQNKQIKLN